MNREIKFRAWDGKDMSQAFTLDDAVQDLVYRSDEPIYLQYTGLKDRHGVEIYQGDLVKSQYINPLGELTNGLDDDSLGEVVFESGAFSIRKKYLGYQAIPLKNFCHRKDGEYKSNFGVEVIYSDDTILEIVGNIYESSELLEQTNGTN